MPVRPAPRALADEVADRLGRPVAEARTLPGHWYADADHHAVEMARVFGRSWVGVAGTDQVEKPGSFRVRQDLEICEAVQRTYDGGLSADGVLSTEHERGVRHVHQLLLAALSASD